jgi:hypothetical protein
LTLTTGDETEIIAFGVAVLLAIGGGIFKVATLRGDMNSKWTRRVDFAVAALDERTIAALEQLRDEVDAILPTDADGFDPAQAIADPVPLFKLAESTVSYYRTRERMEIDFVRLRRLCPGLLGALTGIEVTVVALTAFYAHLLLWAWLRPSGLILGGFAVAGLVGAGAYYVLLQHRLASAEILAGSGGRAASDLG